MLEKWKTAVNKGKVFGTLLTDLLKAFDSLNHELFIAKLNAYGFILPALNHFMTICQTESREQGVNNSYSTWFEPGVPQGSILGPLLFNIFLVDLFFILNKIDIANYADDNATYTSSNDINGLMKSLEEASKELLKWLGDNLMKSNPDKCHLHVSANDHVAIRIVNFQIENTKRGKLLGIQFDNKLSFDYHLSKICKNASLKTL